MPRRRPIPDRRRSATAVLLAVVVLLAVGAAASVTAASATRPASPVGADGQDLTSSEFRALATEAEQDPDALADLRAVRSVDGRPVDVDAALAGASGPALQQRLRTLAGPDTAPVGTGSPTRDRNAAGEILDRDKYQPTRLPRPFRGVLRWLGDRLEPVTGPIGRFLSALISTRLGAIGVALLVALASAALARVLIGRRSRAAVAGRRAAGHRRRDDDPAELERRADEAEAAGDLERALRLRFRAGLVRLDRSGALQHRPDATSGELARDLQSAAFDDLVSTFDEVVYGGRPAAADDVDEARTGWPRVLAEAGSR